MDLEKHRVLPLRKGPPYIGVYGGHSCLHWPRLGGYFLDGSFSWEANFQRSPFLLEHEQLHDGHGSNLEDYFGMRDVKG